MSYFDKVSQYLLVSLMLIFSSGCSTFSTNKLFVVVWAIVSVALCLFRNIKLIIKISNLILLLLAGAIIYSFVNNSIDTQTYLGFSIYLIATFSIVKNSGILFIKQFVNIVVFFSSISIPLYFLQIIMPDTLFEMNNLVGLLERNNSNSLLFNFTYIHANRNCGFMWEPGAYAAILLIALYFNSLVINKDKLINRNSIIIFIALITTLSTLGYLALLFIMAAIIIDRKKYKYFLVILFLLPVFFGLDFLLPKMYKESKGITQELIKTENATDDTKVSVSRSATFIIDFETFTERPLLGYGVDFRTTNSKEIFKKYNENIIRSSGIMNLLLKFGVLGLFLYVFLFYTSFKTYSTRSSALIFVLLMIFILFSNPIEGSPVIFSMLFISYSVKKKNYIVSKKFQQVPINMF